MEATNDDRVRRLIASALLAPILAMLTACEGTGAGGTPEVTLGAPRRCAHCGWIESKQEIRPGIADPDAPAIYEYRVRMADGSSRVFREKAPASWRLRERLIFVGTNDTGSAQPAD